MCCLMTKRTFNIPEEINTLIDSIPNKSQFVSSAIAVAIKEQKKKELLECLDNIQPWDMQGQSSVDAVQEIRQGEMNNL
jgi:hypothetical protein